MKRVAIIGTGKLGTRLAEQLILDKVCDHILLWNRSWDRLKGTIDSLRSWQAVIDRHTMVSELDWDELDNVDLVVIAVKEHYDPRTLLKEVRLPLGIPNDLRHVGVLQDLPLIREVCQGLRFYRKRIIVITNPVDLMTSYVARSLSTAKVFGLGVTLDAARFAYVLSERCGTRLFARDCLLAGEHGGQLVPLKTQWKFAHDRLNTEVWLQHSVQIGFSIVQHLGYTLQDCAAVFSQDISRLLGDDNSGEISAYSMYDGQASIGIAVCHQGASVSVCQRLSASEVSAIQSARDCVAATMSIIDTVM